MSIGKIVKDTVAKALGKKCQICGSEKDVEQVQCRTVYGHPQMMYLCKRCAMMEKLKVY